ncbi:hypothetical protein SAMN04487988_10913 [Algoriphagus hitonicola]|uniref:Uncharacterized protein n=1 Tax=Algoriphagus hitonicola TaxID=435880 RepID=A0A1I2V5F4_9BACT|nr:hypothetical protein SAMN04487988_10913 [Algoriphagus hitonicola]
MWQQVQIRKSIFAENGLSANKSDHKQDINHERKQKRTEAEVSRVFRYLV